MSEPKFTKWPWSVWTSHHEIADTGDYYDEIGVKDGNGRQICVMCGDLDDGVIKANVALIKTSPEMYAMLEELYDNLNRGIKYIISRLVKNNGYPIDLARKCSASNIELARRIKALLKKARGEE